MILALLLLAPLGSAQFVINYPGSRGFNEDEHGDWPCGGFNSVSASRSEFPLTGAPIQIHSTHTQQLLQVIMSVGNEPGDNFNVVVEPTFRETGPQDFCFGDASIPADLNVRPGANATLQVISVGPEGGLYAVSACSPTDQS